MARCECAACGEKFGGVTGFDMHQRIGDAGLTCFPPESAGLHLVNGIWVRPYGQDVPGDRGREPQSRLEGQGGVIS